ncbi:MAG TPA: formate--phosphoribosylaminoimidazolecarboxamide ligase [Methanocella sp.]|nr:formate--phosphoribosylaminoimidazolecarboxamide ligase [Methanocella sp.]
MVISKEDINQVISKYKKKKITICTIASHSSLHVFRGAYDEGFRRCAVVAKGREVPYQRFKSADEYIFVDKFADVLEEETQKKLRDMSAIIVPHGSFVAYVGLDRIESDFRVPIIGNRNILRWEAERERVTKLFEAANIRKPLKINGPDKIDRPCMVKFPGARGGRGYFVTDSPAGFDEKMKLMIGKGWLTPEDRAKAHIEEYVAGDIYCMHYFYSPLTKEVELLGMDRRHEANIDGLVRIPAKDQMEAGLQPTYVVTGNFPIVARESLLDQAFGMGDRLAEVAEKMVAPGLLGAFCIQTMCTDNLEFVAFEISARQDGGTNTFMNGSPYSYLLYGEGMSMGRRYALEIKRAIKEDRLEDIVT